MEFPVVIVGAGPSGATTALHLGRLGVKSLVISKHRNTANTPRAHIFNQRAMEVLRDAGLEKRLEPVSSPAHEMQHTSWLHCLAGEEYGRLWAWGNKPSQKGDYEAASPCSMSDLPQSVLEPILVEESRKLGAQYSFYTEFVSFKESHDGVTVTLRDRSDSESKPYNVKAAYLVGADGARSSVLTALGIPVVGRQINNAFNVHIKADLSKYIAHRPGSLNWILNPDAPDWSAVGNFRMVRPWNEFVVSMHPASKDPGQKDFQPTNEAILKRLYQMIGDDSVKIEILSSFIWTINDQVAERWQNEGGRVLCIGDATHRHPPINGLGSNTCISDAFNLAWKLAYVIKGLAGRSLLDTLTPERKPVGDAIVRRANNGMEAHRTLWGLIGLEPETREKVTTIMASNTTEGEALRAQWRDAIEATEDEVQALGIQMNQIYRSSSAVVVEPGDEPPDISEGKISTLRQVLVSTFPGYHLPHVWLAADSQSERVSTLDICGQGRFTLLTGFGGEEWIKAAAMISAGGGVQVAAYTIGFRRDYIDCYREWCRVRGVDESGAVLVRPDCFVAWRCRSIVPDALNKLTSVLGQILSKSVPIR